jgi:two-component system, LytTR family, response regulator
MKTKTIIIDDNEFITRVLIDQLTENHSDIEIVATSKNGKEGIEIINHHKPDLIFLDIEMPDMNGFEMLGKLNFIDFEVIFITTHSHYAIKAFRFNALDYLAKPINNQELASAIKKVHKFRSKQTPPIKIQNALENIKADHISNQTLYLQTQKGEVLVPLKKLIKIEGNRNYSNLWLENKTKLLSSKNLKHFEDILEDKNFFRCHRSFLVNGDFIIRSVKDSHLVLKNGEELPISRRKKTDVKNWLRKQ